MIATVRKAYASLLGDLAALARAAALWAAFVILLDGFAAWTGVAPEEAAPASVGGGRLLVFSVSSLAGGVLGWLGISAVVVFWHRRILLAEPEPAAMARLDGRVFGYLVAEFLLGLLSVAIMAAIVPVSFLLPGLEWLVLLAGGLAGTLLLARLHLVLPAIAVGDRATNIAVSWRLTRGNAWRLVAAALLAGLPLGLVGGLMAIAAAVLGLGAGAIGAALWTVFGFLQAALIAGLLSHTYRFFRGPAAAG